MRKKETSQTTTQVRVSKGRALVVSEVHCHPQPLRQPDWHKHRPREACVLERGTGGNDERQPEYSSAAERKARTRSDKPSDDPARSEWRRACGGQSGYYDEVTKRGVMCGMRIATFRCHVRIVRHRETVTGRCQNQIAATRRVRVRG
jgi:hypothetical protein